MRALGYTTMIGIPNISPVDNEGMSLPEVQVGYCAAIGEIEAARTAGFDYVELRTVEIATLPSSSYEQLIKKVKSAGIITPVANAFIPSAIKVTGPAVNEAQQIAYVRRAFDRVARLGVGVIVFGSSGARQVPAGFPKEEAFRQLVSLCRRLALEAEAHGITIVIEPLRRQECNIINTASEGLELIKAVDHPNMQLMIDFYHLAIENEDPQIVNDAREHIIHLHIANPHGRGFPLSWDEYDYTQFFTNLRQINYAARISIEALATNFRREAPQSIALLRQAFAQQQGAFQNK